MKTIKKVALATLGKWSEIFLVVGFQIISIPIILAKWSSELLAVWILLQSLVALISLPFYSINFFIFNENLKLGSKNKSRILKNISSSIPFLLFTFILILILVISGNHYLNYERILKIPPEIIDEFKIFVLCFTIIVFLSFGINEFIIHYLNIYGHYVYISIIRLIKFFIVSFIPLTAIFFGYKFFEVGIVLIISHFISLFLFYILILKRLKHERFKLPNIDFKMGFKNYVRSFLLLIRHFVEQFNSTYIRFLIVGIFNLSTLSLFFALRTISGFVRQIVFSVIEPLTIEMMSDIKEKKTKSYNNILSLYFFYIMVFIFPGCIILQYLTPFIFEKWTLGILNFDPYIFLVLIIISLVTSLNLPFKIIVDSFNLNLINLFILVISICAFLITFLYLKKNFGIIGLCFAILIYEIVYFILTIFFANRQYKKINLNLPIKNLIFCSFALLLFIFYSLLLTNLFSVKDIILFKFLIIFCYFFLIILFFKLNNIRKSIKNKI